MLDFNIVTGTDSYKFTHHSMYPKNTERVCSYFESRVGARFPETTLVGLQPIMMKYLAGKVVTREKIEAAAKRIPAHIVGNPNIFNRAGWEHILNEHDGRLPLHIRAVPEGTPVPTSNVLITVENTDLENCAWLTNHIETILSHVWYPSTVATLSREIKKMMAKFLDRTAMSRDALPFMLHDFGYRGVTSVESAGIGGFAHLVNFMGTDTFRAIEVAEAYYGATEMPAFSIPATEHSVMTSRGPEDECLVVEQLLNDFPTGPLAIVGDSYNIYSFAETILGIMFKNRILTRDGVVILRPDSGDPVEVISKLLDIMWDKFGGTLNEKGFKVLDSHVRLIWGDGIDMDITDDVLTAGVYKGYSAENLVFGMGGGLLQKNIDRDVQRFAFKCCAQQQDGKLVDIYKDPLDKTKTSKKGRLSLVKRDGVYKTVPFGAEDDLLVTVFKDGELKRKYTLDEIRLNAAI